MQFSMQFSSELPTIIGLTILLIAIIVYLLFFYHKHERPHFTTQYKPTNKKLYDLSQNRNDGKVDVCLTLNSKEFRFSHNREKEAEIRNIGLMVGKSIELMFDSKYDDIAMSRKRDILNQLKKLTKISTFSNEQYQETEAIINHLIK